MSVPKELPWILLGAGALGIGAVLVFRKKTTPPLTPEISAKVAAQIASSKDPAFLMQLAAGLQKSGADKIALDAVTKAAAITGKPMQVPGNLGMPPITVSPGAYASGALTSYHVVNGDIPGAIAKRFGVGLATLAKANGVNQKRIMGGQIKVDETLTLPPGSVDSGAANHANGTAV